MVYKDAFAISQNFDNQPFWLFAKYIFLNLKLVLYTFVGPPPRKFKLDERASGVNPIHWYNAICDAFDTSNLKISIFSWIPS